MLQRVSHACTEACVQQLALRIDVGKHSLDSLASRLLVLLTLQVPLPYSLEHTVCETCCCGGLDV